jgi:PKD repeat protein
MTKNEKKILVAIATILLSLIPLLSSIQVTTAQTTPSLSIEPSTVSPTSTSDTFDVAVKILGVTNLWAWNISVTYDSQYVAMTKLPVEGDFLKSSHNTLFTPGVLNTTTGKLRGGPSAVCMTADGVSGDGTLVILTFKVLKPIVDTKITVNAESLLSGEITYGRHSTQINPFPSPTYASTTISYIPNDGTPIAQVGQNQTVNQFTKVTLDGSQSQPQDATDQTYTWTFTDNESRTLTGKTIDYTFIWPGTFPITLTVTNSKGTSTAVMGITVIDTTPPVAIITTDGYNGQSVPVNQLIIFYSNESYDPYKLPLGGSVWDFGDGQTSNELAVSHSYSTSGTYTVTLTRSNSAGLPATATKTIIVGNGASSTTDPDATESPSITNTPQPGLPTNSPSNLDNGNNQSSDFSLPSTILYPLIFATVLALGGSVFWLKKNNN